MKRALHFSIEVGGYLYWPETTFMNSASAFFYTRNQSTIVVTANLLALFEVVQ